MPEENIRISFKESNIFVSCGLSEKIVDYIAKSNTKFSNMYNILP
jgi:glutaredoxin-related protein